MSRSMNSISSLAGRTMDFRLWFSGLLCCQVLLAGCADESLQFTEVKRISEKVTESELQTFLRIINLLTDKKLPDSVSIFAPPPDWNLSRTLSVSKLVNEEIKLIRERSSVEKLAEHLQKNRRLQRALRREKLTPEQFVGLSLAIGVAIGRSTLRRDQDLDRIIQDGEKSIKSLETTYKDSFNQYKDEDKHRILRQAVWITRKDRAQQLKEVPPENYIDLVQRHGDVLKDIFPPEFTSNPLDAVADLLEEQGIPFQELDEERADDKIDWTQIGEPILPSAVYATEPDSQ